MREPLSFFTPVSYGTWNPSRIERLLEWVDDCFSFGGHKAVLLSPSVNPDRQRVELRAIPATKIALKIAAWAICFVAALSNPLVWCAPAALLALKVALRKTHPFYFETDPLGVSRAVKIPPRSNFRELRNHVATSNLDLIPYRENGAAVASIYAHSHLLTEFFEAQANSVMVGGRMEEEGKRVLDWSGQPFATAQNIHMLLDFYYGLGIDKNLTLNELLNLFEFADYVLAHELKKEILALLLLIPESREDVRLAPVFRKMLLSPQLNDEEFERLFEWYMECTFSTLSNAIKSDEVMALAAKGDVRAQLLVIKEISKTSDQYGAQLASKKHPLGQFMRHAQLDKHDPAQALQLLRESAQRECASAIGLLGVRFHYGELGLPKDDNRAFELAERAAERGSLYGVLCLGMVCNSSSEERIRDSAKAFEHLYKAAQIGYRHAEYRLGKCFEFGYGTKIDKPRALEYYMKAKYSFEKRNDHSLDAHLAQAIQRVIT